MKLLIRGRLWQLERKKTLPENIGMAVRYFESKYDETFELAAMRPEDRKSIEANICCGLRLVSDAQVTPGCIFLTREK